MSPGPFKAAENPLLDEIGPSSLNVAGCTPNDMYTGSNSNVRIFRKLLSTISRLPSSLHVAPDLAAPSRVPRGNGIPRCSRHPTKHLQQINASPITPRVQLGLP